MKIRRLLVVINLLLVSLVLTGCRRNMDEIWEDSKTAKRHISRGFRSLGGRHGDSRQIRSREEFMPLEDPYMEDAYGSDFIPFPDSRNSTGIAMSEGYVIQPRETPGDPGSSIPGIDSFRDPSAIPALCGTFRNLHFDLNSDLIKGQENLNIIRQITAYMNRFPNIYVFIEGHCDERGPEAFNLALGVRRSNTVRNQLINEGVNPNNIFTISYGKERPLVLEHHEGAWAQNRRAEFKVYQR